MSVSPNPHIEALKQEAIATKKALDITLKEKALDDLYMFNKYILNIEKGKDKVPLGDFHKELCHFVTDKQDKKKLILVPRGHLKSSLVTVGYSLQQILKNPSIRILIRNAVYGLAVDFLNEIKKNLIANENIQRIWGDLAHNPAEWSEARMSLRASKEKFGRREPTVTVAGIETSLVSQHYDLIIDDDVVNRENTYTKEQIDKVNLRYKDALDLLEPSGQYIVIGTRWDDGDLYGTLIRAVKEGRENFEVYVRGAYQGSLETDQGFEALWPQKYTRDILHKLFLSKGTYEFYAQYMNDIAPSESATFKQDYFKYYDMSDLKGKQMNRYLLIDPAFEVKKDSDFTALVSVGIDEFGNIFVLDIINQRLMPGQTIDLIFQLYEQYHYTQVGIEEVTFGKTLQYQIYDEMKKRGRYLPIAKLKPGGRSKDARIMALEPLYKSAKVFHNVNVRNISQLEYQLTHYPRATNDDVIDALAYAVDVLAPVRIRREYRNDHKYMYTT